MFIYTAKVTKTKLVAIVLIIGAIIAGIVLLKPTENAYDALSEQQLEAEMVSITVSGISSNEDRVIFLNQRGLEVSENEIDVKSVQIPKEFDEVFEKYNEMQKESGFNLERFQGKTVEMYTYEVLNMSNADDEIHANILIYKNKIIGGDVSSVKLDGFITGFEKID